MLKFNYINAFNDFKLKEAIIKVVKEKTNLPDTEIEKYILDRINFHGNQMNGYIDGYLSGYQSKKNEGHSKTELDRQLDIMVEKMKEESLKFEKVK